MLTPEQKAVISTRLKSFEKRLAALEAKRADEVINRQRQLSALRRLLRAAGLNHEVQL